MTITPSVLSRWSGIAAAVAGAIFIGVQINHPELSATSITTTDVFIRDCLKILMCSLALAGITGMYASQVRRNGVLGFLGYVVLSAGYLGMLAITFTAAFVLPEVASLNPGFVNDVLVANTARGTVKGDIGALQTVFKVVGFAYLVGGLLFGIALYRARVLTRWAAALLAVGGVVSAALAVMPDAFYRFLAFPNGIAMIVLGYSLWMISRTDDTVQPAVVDTTLSSAGV
jgi:hypothetical protein